MNKKNRLLSFMAVMIIIASMFSIPVMAVMDKDEGNEISAYSGNEISDSYADSNNQNSISSSVTVFDTTANSSSSSLEEYVVFGKIEQKDNEISDSITAIGVALIILGIVGIVCVIAWCVVGRNSKKILNEELHQVIDMADARNKAEINKVNNRNFARPTPKPPVRSYETTPQTRNEPISQTPKSSQSGQTQKNMKNSRYDVDDILAELLNDREK